LPGVGASPPAHARVDHGSILDLSRPGDVQGCGLSLPSVLQGRPVDRAVCRSLRSPGQRGRGAGWHLLPLR